METLHLIFGLTLAAFVWYFSALPSNILAARKTGLPMVILPVDPDTPIWLVLSSMFQPQLEACLPRVVYDRIKLAIFGWEFRERWSSTVEKLGKSFIIVTPGKNAIWTADPQAMTEVLLRRKDFLQLELASKMLSLFGMNLTASNGETWQRHRKATAPILNERIMVAVWQDSLEQTQEMLEEFTDQGSSSDAETNEVVEGIRTIAINIIGSIVYGSRSSWKQTIRKEEASAGYTLTFVDAMSTVINNLIVPVFIPAHFLSQKWMPASAQKLGMSLTEFSSYGREFVAEQRTRSQTSNNLLGSLVRYADQHKPDTVPTRSSLYLSEDEIIGNLFNYTVAGFDTTSITTTYAILSLALEPQWQEWLVEEINHIDTLYGSNDYGNVFPASIRCLAIMYESLRLYTPIMHLTRRVVQHQTAPFRISPGTSIFVAPSLTHVCPEYYGDDALIFRPSRWIENGTLLEPRKGVFLPWSSGPRHCPGLKMSQVEFVAILRQIFSNWGLQVAQRAGESEAQAKERLLGLIKESQPKATQQLRRPNDVWLKFVKRSKAKVASANTTD